MILRSKSGASILFVLAAMALLLTVGVATLTAASANAGARIDRMVRTRVELYADSLQRTIMRELEVGIKNDINEPLTSATTLGGQLLRVAYTAYIAGANSIKRSFDNPSIDVYNSIDNAEISITVDMSDVLYSEATIIMTINDDFIWKYHDKDIFRNNSNSNIFRMRWRRKTYGDFRRHGLGLGN